MSVIADRPSIHELEQLTDVMSSSPLNRESVVGTLRGIEVGLMEHARGLDREGGLLDEGEKAARMSLAREDERLRLEVSQLLRDAAAIRREASSEMNDDELRRRIASLVAGLRGHRDAEASLVIESAATEVGSGD